MAWMTLTLAFAFTFDSSYYMWNRVMKIDLMILVALVVLHSKHIYLLVWMLVLLDRLLWGQRRVVHVGFGW